MATFEAFDSLEDMIAAMRTRAEDADRLVEPWQEALKPGDHVVRFESGLALFSTILDPVAEAKAYADDGSEDEAVAEARATYGQPHMKHFRYTRSYSISCPEGEYGDIHVVTALAKISKADFEAAKAAGWG